MRALEFITGHVIYNPAYTYKFQLKTTDAFLDCCQNEALVSNFYLEIGRFWKVDCYFYFYSIVSTPLASDFDPSHFLFFQRKDSISSLGFLRTELCNSNRG